MSIIEKLTSVKDTVPHYWPLGSFIHHNPLKGFEGLHFKDGLAKAKSIFGGKVYMDSSYYMDLYEEGKIDEIIFENNLKKVLSDRGLDIPLQFAKKFLMEVSPKWSSLRIQLLSKKEKIDDALYAYLENDSIFHDKQEWLDKLIKHMTLYEINDALFNGDDKENVEKNIVEFISRFLDEDQTTMRMPNRELGMFEAFKLFENFSYDNNAESFVEESFKQLHVKDVEAYLLTHLLKLHGWAGFIKYRSEDKDYIAQRQHPSTLIEYLAIRLYYELRAVKNHKLSNFDLFQEYAHNNLDDAILKLLAHKHMLFGQALDALESNEKIGIVLSSHISSELNLDALQIQHSNEVLQSSLPLTELAAIIKKLREEEGYIWLKSLEDSYIHSYVDNIINVKNKVEEQVVASATFCLDVRSEVIRRSIEKTGPYQTYGAGGFLGIPIAFVEFDKAHELFLSPAIVKPQNVVFEIPVESHDEYSSKTGMNKTTKKVLSDLKNNPYTPYIMVEAIGWIFGINLFGKTFLPQKTNKLLSKLKPYKPKTTYTLDKLSLKEIEFYVAKLHTRIIASVLADSSSQDYSEDDIKVIRNHLLFNDDLTIAVSDETIEKLKTAHQITSQDYEYQKKKLAMVGFTLEEKVAYLQKYLKMIGQVSEFPEFITIIGHGSLSDNNPFESALDCGACGGNVSLPNTRTLCMIANTKDVREKIKEQGIFIPESTKFIPGLHITTTDEIKFYDTDILTDDEMQKFSKVKDDFNNASMQSRVERSKSLPYTHTHKDIMIKSMDWSEIRPEWGLAKNMGVFAGPRNSTKHLVLNNRFFMHSYDWKVDNENAEILTAIFNGPLIIGEWINLEHYFSTVDNHIYGAGSKVYHNIVSKIGVFSGNYGDLKIGLPIQSVYLEGEPYHEPVRLLSFVEAPLEIVGKAVENSIAKPFILNEWIRPVIIDREAKKVYSYENGEFIVIKEIA
ncbi:MAG: Na-translocating system protein MpsB [Sulfuricurvum sp.]|nr:Na-translocating system protein MpsB [Sulfuricurvum sp.]